MPRRRNTDTAALDQLLKSNERVVTHRLLRSLDVPSSTITARIAVRGPWQRLLPGLVLAHRGIPTRRERELGALAYVGDGAVISGSGALLAHGVRSAPALRLVHVLAPAARQRRSFSYVHIDRTRRSPKPVMINGLPYAPVARAVVDCCRLIENLDEVRELVAEAVQRRLCSVSDLIFEVRSSARQRTGLARHAIHEMSEGVRSVAEAKARAVFTRRGVPQPLWNIDLVSEDGEFIARPDGYWEHLSAALEIDSMAWHLGPAAYRRTQRRQRDLTALGVLVLPVAPQDIMDDEDRFIRDVLAHLAEAARRTPPSGIFVRRRPAA